MRAPRIQQIEEYVLKHNTVSLKELCDKFQVSMSTIRRDVAELVQRGTIKKVYGGVSANSQPDLVPFHARSNINQIAKQVVCDLALQFVEEGDVIFIDTGSTTCNMVEGLAKFKNITVITNNIDVIIRAIPYPNIQLFSLPGMLNRKNNSFSPMGPEDIFHNYNITKAFLAAGGISLEGHVTNNTPLETPVKQAAIQRAEQNILLVDSSKFGASSLITFCKITDLDKIITDKRPDDKYINYCREHSIDLIFPQ
ncbi:MAG: DeoR/GlpR transcriptional regulator [Thermoanaerobacteraceae bacterium]|nr:DeoR/GlpR transcriptional regulator [Thermoanaerobacteraceae bacterium]